VIAGAWQEYHDKVIPGTADEVQISETRKAFYAGAMSVFMGVIGGLSAGDEAQPEDLALLDDIQREIDEFLAVATRDGTGVQT
jgi:hypothetical protein